MEKDTITPSSILVSNEICGGCGCHFETEPHHPDCPNLDGEGKKEQARLRRNRLRRERNQAMRDLGLVRVRGALGGVYWE